MSTLLERVDVACDRAGKTRGDLAAHLGVSVQSISNMKRKGPNAGMRTENVARAARFLGCDVYWLCTGEPEEYQAADARSQLAQEAALLIDQMDPATQNDAFTKVYLLWKTRARVAAPAVRFRDESPHKPEQDLSQLVRQATNGLHTNEAAQAAAARKHRVARKV